MLTAIIAAALMAQCPGGVRPPQATRYQAAVIRPATPASGSTYQACTVPRRGFRLFRRCR